MVRSIPHWAVAAAIAGGAVLAPVLAAREKSPVSATSRPAARANLPLRPLGGPAGYRDPFERLTINSPTAPVAVLEPVRTPSLSFEGDVMPVLDKAGCSSAACHGAGGGKGGLALSLFGAYPADDYAAIVQSAAGRRIDLVRPDKSLLLLKASGAVPHGGADCVPRGAQHFELLRAWIAQGAPWGGANVPRIESFELSPTNCSLEKGASQKVTVSASYFGGKRRDVSDDAVLRSSDPTVVSVEGGNLQAKGYGQAAVIVTYRRRSAVVTVSVPQPLPSAFPELPTTNKIDELVLAQLKALGIPPSPVCTDAEFLRRVYLDSIGVLPTPAEAKAFLADTDPQRRAKLIDKLLQREEFADHWALKWGDLLRIKSEYPSNLWPNGVQAYYRWIRQAIARNKPYDQFVRELLVSSGSNFRDGPCNYYRALKRRDPQGFAEATALVFMGARLECARCHAHPTEGWTRDDNLGMAAFFAQVQFKGSQEWKEEIVYLDPDRKLRDPRTGAAIAPKYLGGAAPQFAPGEDPRVKFAAWLTSPENPWFARNIVNRVWYWLLGRGIVQEPDDLRPTNPPSNPALLAHLERELVSHKYDLRHIYRLILNSQVYQLSSRTSDQNAADVTMFSHYGMKRLGSEQLVDAIGQVTETSEEFTSAIPEPYTVLPRGWRAEQLADGSIGTPVLELFGRPSRDTAYESERCTQTSMGQELYLVSSAQLDGKVSKSPRIDRLMKAGKSDAEIVEELYLAALSRPCSDEEKQKVLTHVAAQSGARKQALQDVMWALLNTKEFLFNH